MNNSDFKNRIRYTPIEDTSIGSKRPPSNKITSPEQAQHLVNTIPNNEEYLNRMVHYFKIIQQFIKDNFPFVTYKIEARLKSPASARRNIQKPRNDGSYNIDDIGGIKIVITGVDSEYSDMEYFENVMSRLEPWFQKNSISLNNPNFSNLGEINYRLKKLYELKQISDGQVEGNYEFTCLEEVELENENSKRIANKKQNKKKKNENIKTDIKEVTRKYYNIDVLFVEEIERIIKLLEVNFDIPLPEKKRITIILREAQASTNYGASKETSRYLVDYFNSLSGPEINKYRLKHLIGKSPYTGYHISFTDSLLSFPLEVQFRSMENDIIAELGGASHPKREGKKRTLPEIHYDSKLAPKKNAELLIKFFTPENAQQIKNEVPRYIIADEETREPIILDEFDSFLKYYRIQLDKEISSDKKAAYIIGYQYALGLIGRLPREYYEHTNSNNYPYNAIIPTEKEIQSQLHEKEDFYR